MTSSSAVAESAYQRMVVEKSMSLSQFLEELGPSLLSDSPDTRESSLSDVVAVVVRLPNDYLTDQQVGLLLDFLLGRLETSALAGGNVLDGIRHLVLFSANRPADFEIPLFQILFRDGNVQGWPQKDRAKHYDIMQWLLTNRIKSLLPLGSDLVMSFIRAMGGERDPRCLLQVFRLFLLVASSFPLGPLVEDMFEVVACYYPVEFKPLVGDDSITREMLSSACQATLTAHPSFAPFCLMLIEEKMEDDETSHEQKEDVCTLISAAARVFPAANLLPFLGSVAGGIRSVALDPKQKTGPCSASALSALTSLASAMEKSGKDKAMMLANDMTENVEPFILQAEMGLSARALSLLRSLVESSPTASRMVLDKAVAWILSLVQGTTVNAAGNRGDICREGLVFILEWIQLARRHAGADTLNNFESALFASLQEAREIAPMEAKIAIYGCLEEYLLSPPFSPSLADLCSSFVTQGLQSVESDKEKLVLLSFISTHSKCRWNEHLSLLQSAVNKDSDKYCEVLLASVVGEESWRELRPEVERLLSQSLTSVRVSSLVECCQRLRDDVTVVDAVSGCLSTAVLQADTALLSGYVPTALQSIGLLISASLHSSISKKAIEQGKTDVFRLLIAQSEDASLLLSAISTSSASCSSLPIFVFSAVNRSGDVAILPALDPRPDWIDEVLAKALLLAGNRNGVERVKRIFDQLSSSSSSDGSVPCVTSLFDFDSPKWDPSRGRYRTTALWRQRIFCQTVPHYISAVVAAADKSRLLCLLPQILHFAEKTGPSVQSELSKFLPVFVAALSLSATSPSSTISPSSSPSLAPSSSVISALPSFLTGLRKDQLDPLSVAIIAKRLSIIVGEQSDLSTILSCLTSLDLLARRADSSSTQPLISCVVGAATQSLAHKKRVVRQQAAVVKNTWESLIAK